jgi:hypothetical protein
VVDGRDLPILVRGREPLLFFCFSDSPIERFSRATE